MRSVDRPGIALSHDHSAFVDSCSSASEPVAAALAALPQPAASSARPAAAEKVLFSARAADARVASLGAVLRPPRFVSFPSSDGAVTLQAAVCEHGEAPPRPLQDPSRNFRAGGGLRAGRGGLWSRTAPHRRLLLRRAARAVRAERLEPCHRRLARSVPARAGLPRPQVRQPRLRQAGSPPLRPAARHRPRDSPPCLAPVTRPRPRAPAGAVLPSRGRSRATSGGSRWMTRSPQSSGPSHTASPTPPASASWGGRTAATSRPCASRARRPPSAAPWLAHPSRVGTATTRTTRSGARLGTRRR